MTRQTVIVDIPVDIPQELLDISKTFSYVLLKIGSLYELQLQKDLSVSVENGIWREILRQLRSPNIPEDQRERYEEQINNLEKGIYDLYPITVLSNLEETNLIIGKIFASEGDRVSYYSGVVGIVNNDYNEVIKQFDSRLDELSNKVLPETIGQTQSVKNKAPVIKCLDVFSLAGALDVSHKPICVFFSGEYPENISSLSNMTVFLNLYSERFRALTMELGKRYLVNNTYLVTLSDSEISMLLLIWLRGHDVGHFIGQDNLIDKMAEFDRDYMILHELKSDMIALYSIKLFSNDLLGNGMAEKMYYLSVAEMLRYIRRGNILQHPDSASAYIAWRYFENLGALKYDLRHEGFVLDTEAMENAISKFTEELLKIFKDGNPDEARKMVARYGSMEISGEDDLSPIDCSENLRQVINDTDIPHYIDYNFIIDK